MPKECPECKSRRWNVPNKAVIEVAAEERQAFRDMQVVQNFDEGKPGDSVLAEKKQVTRCPECFGVLPVHQKTCSRGKR